MEQTHTHDHDHDHAHGAAHDRDQGHVHDHEHAHHHDDDEDDDDDASGRRVVISSRDGLEAWADLKIGVPTGRRVAVHLAVGKITATNVNGRLELETSNGPVVVNGSKGEVEVEVGSGDVQLSASEADQLSFLTGLAGPPIGDPFPSVHGIETASAALAAFLP